MLKVGSGATGSVSQWFWDPVTGNNMYQDPIGGQTLQAPAIAQYNTTEFHVVELGTDHQIWQSWYDSKTGLWYPWQPITALLPGPTGGFTSAPSIATYGTQFHVVVRGGSNNHLWHAYYDPSSGWHGWEDITPSGAVGSASAPAATAYTGSGDRQELHVYYLSDDSSRNIMDEVYNAQSGPANAWGSPSVVEQGPFASAPAACQYKDQLQLWAVWGANNHVYQYWHGPSSGWGTAWQESNDVAGSAPAVAPYNSQFQLWYTLGGTSGGTTVRQAYYDATTGAWTGPYTWGNMGSAPAITQYGSEFQAWWRD